MKKAYSVNLQVQFLKHGKQVIAYSPALDISTVGKSQGEARKRFSELTHLFLKEIIDAGTAEDVLSGLGWKRARRNKNISWQPPTVSSASIGVRVPIFA